MSTQPDRPRAAERFAADDSDVIVVIGSGAGGGTLANELCQKGVKVVLLEAGERFEPEDFIDDEWPSFNQLAWLGRAHHVRLVADRQGLPEPAGVDVQGGRRHDGALGGLLPALQGVGVPDPLRARAHRRGQPARLADRLVRPRALLRPGRAPDGRDAHERHPGVAGQQQLQGDGQRRQARRLPGRQHGPDGVQHRAARWAAGDDPGRLQLPGRQAARALVDAHR